MEKYFSFLHSISKAIFPKHHRVKQRLLPHFLSSVFPRFTFDPEFPSAGIISWVCSTLPEQNAKHSKPRSLTVSSAKKLKWTIGLVVIMYGALLPQNLQAIIEIILLTWLDRHDFLLNKVGNGKTQPYCLNIWLDSLHACNTMNGAWDVITSKK